MCGLGATEMMIILILALLVFGPSKLPELAKGVGKALREFKKASKELKDQASTDDDLGAAMREVEAARVGAALPADDGKKQLSSDKAEAKAKERAKAKKAAAADDEVEAEEE